MADEVPQRKHGVFLHVPLVFSFFSGWVLKKGVGLRGERKMTVFLAFPFKPTGSVYWCGAVSRSISLPISFQGEREFL